MEKAPIHILLIDDNPADRRLAARALTSDFESARLQEVENRMESFQQVLDAGGFDVVVTDYQLRWTTGLHVLRAVK